MITPFGQLLGQLRRRAGLGLRTFAELVDERASTVSAIECGMRTPWHRQETLSLVADVLGLVSSSPFCDEFFQSARNTNSDGGSVKQPPPGMLGWWWTTDHASALDQRAIQDLAEFIGATSGISAEYSADETATAARELTRYPALTELAAEWRVRKLLGRREAQFAAAPVDVEAVLENQAGVRLEIIPGLIPHFSVQACAVMRSGEITLLVDRIVADSRPLASYRELLARCYAPRALWIDAAKDLPADWFLELQQTEDWPQLLRDCERFALSMLLPAAPVLSAASSAYREVVEQQGWVETDTAACAVRNRLAEQFAVPPLLVHTRLVRWPCHVYGRIAQALAAEEFELPPVDWFEVQEEPRQQLLFEKSEPVPQLP
ncbi:helix-turn-helix domain-containing protein [Bythopirellula goksoeyrii]|uniref:helix-turn-helix domain-containing protein n=1 Tax=Bythopirellula goksoeyrii TaxID=1400387 RepID=UPI0011CD3985|nr:helix-turn-helix transcriptional regulator [Bythopirellula goksoeyrii]